MLTTSTARQCLKSYQRKFDWMNEQQLKNFDVNSIPDDADTGYILEVDLKYPAAIHDIYSNLPVAPESRKV